MLIDPQKRNCIFVYSPSSNNVLKRVVSPKFDLENTCTVVVNNSLFALKQRTLEMCRYQNLTMGERAVKTRVQSPPAG